MAVAEGKLFSEALKDRYKEEFEIAGIVDTKAAVRVVIVPQYMCHCIHL
jgi:hypothetical protein